MYVSSFGGKTCVSRRPDGHAAPTAAKKKKQQQQ